MGLASKVGPRWWRPMGCLGVAITDCPGPPPWISCPGTALLLLLGSAQRNRLVSTRLHAHDCSAQRGVCEGPRRGQGQEAPLSRGAAAVLCSRRSGGQQGPRDSRRAPLLFSGFGLPLLRVGFGSHPGQENQSLFGTNKPHVALTCRKVHGKSVRCSQQALMWPSYGLPLQQRLLCVGWGLSLGRELF